ncbi:hypothetical protein [Flavobacterium sp. CLA17]|uniref:hypothetical protein n=1 Tax=Flavobacterium sp. CLA17 TaxID=2724135 RepID=UPI00149093F5|nr:hypothetical protein [Flavobacterium sp. CLA17]QSB29281.1 hypothetical protein HAV12_011255 [Flavobacterium sp. CLA17]
MKNNLWKILWFVVLMYNPCLGQTNFELKESIGNELLILPNAVGDFVGIDQKINHAYHKGLLRISLPDSLYMKKRIQLKFFKKTDYYFWNPPYGNVNLYMDKTQTHTLIFKRGNEVFLRPEKFKSDSLSVINAIYNQNIQDIKNFAKMNNSEKQKYKDVFFNKLIAKYNNKKKYRSVIKNISFFLDNQDLISACDVLENDLGFVETESANHAYYGAYLFSNRGKEIGLICKAILASDIKSTFSSIEIQNIQNILRFMDDPEILLSFDVKVDLQLFSQSIKNFIRVTIDKQQPSPLKLIKVTKPFFGGNLELTSIADGLARFLSERIEEEFNRDIFSNVLLSNKDLIDFFPETYALVETAKKNQFWTIKDLQSASNIDIENLPLNILKWNKKQLLGVENQYSVAYENIYTILESDNIENVFSLENDSIQQIGLANLIYKNISNTISQQHLLSLSELNNLNSQGRKYFYSLLFVQSPKLYKSLTAARDAVRNDFLSKTPLSFEERAFDFFNKLTEISKLYNDYKIDRNVKENFKGNVKENVKENAKWLNRIYLKVYKDFYFEDELKNNELTELQEYSLKVINFIQGSRMKTSQPFLMDLSDILYMPLKGHLTDEFENKNNKIKVDHQLSTINSVVKLNFVFTAMKEAKNIDEVLNVIETISLPSKATTYKSYSNLTVSIQSYPGIAYAINKNNQFISPTIPLGVALTKKTNNEKLYENYSKFSDYKKNRNASPSSYFSLFLYVFDLGNPFSFNLNSERKNFPRLKSEALFNPGLKLGYTISNFPLSFMAGVDYNLDYNGKREFFTSISLNFDLPLYYLLKN